jgi:low affinity Fe/Cu permease
MSSLKENLGDGYQQVMIGFATFIAGAVWGGMSAGADMVAADIYWPAVVMLSGAMITLLGTTFGTNHEDDRSNDLQDALDELTAKLDSMLNSKDDSDDE